VSKAAEIKSTQKYLGSTKHVKYCPVFAELSRSIPPAHLDHASMIEPSCIIAAYLPKKRQVQISTTSLDSRMHSEWQRMTEEAWNEELYALTTTSKDPHCIV